MRVANTPLTCRRSFPPCGRPAGHGPDRAWCRQDAPAAARRARRKRQAKTRNRPTDRVILGRGQFRPEWMRRELKRYGHHWLRKYLVE